MMGAGESIAPESPEEADDAVLPATRALSAFIVPFLVVAFVVLFGFPGDTDRLFAWKVAPPMTPMTLGAVYLGGAYFFVRVFLTKDPVERMQLIVRAFREVPRHGRIVPA